MIELIPHDDVTRVRMWTRRSTIAGYDVSAYLVRGILVDTGFRHVRNDLDHALSELRPRGLLVTHWHEDHAGNAPALAERYPMWMAPYTERKLREHEQVKPYRHFIWGRPPALTAMLRPLDVGPLEVIATPGHSPDHHVVFDRETGTLFSGDLWLGVKVRVMGLTENLSEILASLDRAIALEPRRMFDAHRGLVEQPVAALQAKRDWLVETMDAVARRIAAGDDENTIVRTVLGGDETTALVSQGEYSRRNLVRAVARELPMPR